MILSLFTLSYLLGGVVTYGAVFAHVQNRWPDIANEMYRLDMFFAALMGAIFPVSIIALLILEIFKLNGDGLFKYGLKFI